MAITIRKGQDKSFLCKVGLHGWGRWRVISAFSSNVEDYERKCLRCGQIKRKTLEK